jgi:hypothetical protein
MTVSGVVHSAVGGFKFPDGTTQTTSAEGGAATNATLLTFDGTNVPTAALDTSTFTWDGTTLSVNATTGSIAAGTLLVVARMAADQSNIADSTWTHVEYGTELYDCQNAFASGVFTVPQDGWYGVDASFRWQGFSNPGKLGYIGVAVASVTNVIEASSSLCDSSVSCSVRISGSYLLSSNQTVRIVGLHGDGTSTPDMDAFAGVPSCSGLTIRLDQ